MARKNFQYYHVRAYDVPLKIVRVKKALVIFYNPNLSVRLTIQHISHRFWGLSIARFLEIFGDLYGPINNLL